MSGAGLLSSGPIGVTSGGAVADAITEPQPVRHANNSHISFGGMGAALNPPPMNIRLNVCRPPDLRSYQSTGVRLLIESLFALNHVIVCCSLV